MTITYKDAGVDIEKGDAFVARIKKKVQSTYGKEVQSGIGGFASLYEFQKGKYLAAGTDGVGTKLMIAHTLGIHNTVGIDLVAMCANDVVCTGARPLFFLDYIGCGKLELKVSEAIIDGIVKGCKETGMALVGGETAEMPGMYDDGEYDLAGFAVGEVRKSNLLDGKKMQDGDELVGIASSGLHSNGFSLVRKLINSNETEILKSTLTPTKLYVKSALALLKEKKFQVRGFAHITGSGFYNIPRINSKFRYIITHLPPEQKIFTLMKERSGLGARELYSTFNMGVGFVVACKKGQSGAIIKFLRSHKEKAFFMGYVKKGNAQVEIQPHAVELV